MSPFYQGKRNCRRDGGLTLLYQNIWLGVLPVHLFTSDGGVPQGAHCLSPQPCYLAPVLAGYAVQYFGRRCMQCFVLDVLPVQRRRVSVPVGNRARSLRVTNPVDVAVDLENNTRH